MTVKPYKIWELRYTDQSSTYPTAFVSGSAAGWSNATKLRAFDAKLKLAYGAEKDATVQTAGEGHPAPIVTDRAGGTLEFSMHLEGGSSTTSPPSVATLLGAALGGLKSCSKITDTALADCTTGLVKCTSHGKAVGEAVLVGVRGDSGGDGKLVYVDTVANANQYWVRPLLPAAPAVSAALKNGHTVYIDQTVERYLSFYLIGSYSGSGATDDPDQVNMIGCSCAKIAIAGIAQGQSPKVTFTFNLGDWRNEPNATKATISHTAAAAGNNPAGNLALGSLCIGDASAYTRNAIQGGNVEVDPAIAIERISDPNGANYTGGWVQSPSETGPTCSITRYWGDMPGGYDDFVAGTAKTIVCQWGHVAQGVFAFGLQRAYLSSVPERVEFSKSMALKMVHHGDMGRNTDRSTDDYKLQDSPLWFWFH
jgi:hypothetical protein